MIVKEFYDKSTNTLSYVIHQQDSAGAIVIDPVLDLDPVSGTIEEHSVQQILDYLSNHKLQPEMCLETHAHADHLSGSQIIKQSYPDTQIAISERIVEVQKIFSKLFNIDAKTDGSQFDYLIKDYEEKSVAGFTLKEIPTPGHTPACSSYLIEDIVFTGDTMFMPDYGVGRCDFPGGCSKQLYKSITEGLYSLPDNTRMFVGHDYQPGGRELKFVTTVGEQKKQNIQLRQDVSESNFTEMRNQRDKTLNTPKLLLPSIQVNILAGHLPDPDDNGTRYLRIPLTYAKDHR